MRARRDFGGLIEDISHDLDYGNIPPEKISYSVWKDARNREKARSRGSARKETTMSEDKLKHGVDDVQKYEEQCRDTDGPEHGSGNPNLQPGELQDSEAWKSHKSSPATKEQKPTKQVKPRKRA